MEVYYKAISFYLSAHPSLLVDMLKVRGHCFWSHAAVDASATCICRFVDLLQAHKQAQCV